MSLVRFLARPLLAAAVVAQGIDVFRHPGAHAVKAAPLVHKVSESTGVPDEPEKYVKASGAVLAVAGGLLATGIAPRAAGFAIAGVLTPVTAYGYQFWRIRDKEERVIERRTFLTNMAIVGGALLAGVDTSGKPSLAWRAQSRRETRRQVAEAVELAAAQATRKATKAAARATGTKTLAA